jgi:hypothetical protein
MRLKDAFPVPEDDGRCQQYNEQHSESRIQQLRDFGETVLERDRKPNRSGDQPRRRYCYDDDHKTQQHSARDYSSDPTAFYVLSHIGQKGFVAKLSIVLLEYRKQVWVHIILHSSLPYP